MHNLIQLEFIRSNGSSPYASSFPRSLCREPERLSIHQWRRRHRRRREGQTTRAIDLPAKHSWHFCCINHAYDSIVCDVQIYVVYLGHLASSGNPSEPETLSTATVEVAHHDLLSKVLDDGRSSSTQLLPDNMAFHSEQTFFSAFVFTRLKFREFSVTKN